MQVPFLDLRAQSRQIREEVLPLWAEVLDTAGYVGGKFVEGFEADFAKAAGAKHAIAVANGTDALTLAFVAIGMKPGDEVITPPNTFIATTEAIEHAGGKPVFVDIDPRTYNIDPAKIEAAITKNTVGIVPIHLYGQPADMDPILEIAKKHKLWVVEDSAQAHLAEYKGRRCGSMGVAAEFSFYPGKNLGACGEAGAVTTNDDAINGKVRMLRDHGQAKKYYHDLVGYNGRCDSIQAAALGVKLRHLPAWTEARRKNAARYRERLAGVENITLPYESPDCKHVYHLFVIQVDNREAVMEALKAKDIATALHYPIPLHLQNAYKHLGIPKGTYPVSEAYSERLLSLPMFAELTEDQVDYVCENLKAAVS